MGHSIEYDPATGITVVTGTGPWTLDAFESALSEAMPIVAMHRSLRVLLDFRQVTPAFSFPDIFAVMRGVSESAREHGVAVERIKRACVLAPEHLGEAHGSGYAGAVMSTYGQPVRFFEDIDAATDWLME